MRLFLCAFAAELFHYRVVAVLYSLCFLVAFGSESLA
jgi:hypothetical protein